MTRRSPSSRTDPHHARPNLPESSEPSPTDHHNDPAANHCPDTVHEPAQCHELQLYTPSAAAEILAVKESWLRRKAGTRSIPCTFLGRHLRFSRQDLHAIAHQGAQPIARHRGRPRAR